MILLFNLMVVHDERSGECSQRIIKPGGARSPKTLEMHRHFFYATIAMSEGRIAASSIHRFIRPSIQQRSIDENPRIRHPGTLERILKILGELPPLSPGP